MRAPRPLATRNDGGLSRPAYSAIVLGLVAILAIGWAAVTQVRMSSLEDEVQHVHQDNAELRANANANAYTFAPTEITPPNMRGMVFIGTAGSGVVAVSNLPPAGDGHSFQLWLVNDDDSATAAGALFVTATGEGFALIPADSSGYMRIAISLEPDEGRGVTAGGYLLVVDVNAARGERSPSVQ